ncbi:hypothetical protein CLL_A2628 [Clostridium botulinum B str. Eklund 17B (NRP)]|uniref:Uncharacterized protein n=1 Tax=Clostridium botulinum (strain Eklund 17B / Type B) TaxID=935198 RepID=B2TNK9_CLOBB|nr:hypothetical protein CLL_A2628 [Clostridium botulinum B str. Eklund 17B (NRP)]CDH91533.1 conserved hypothetical protein [Clostridium botulinum B str. Eklund 17B (NRP)]
MEVTTTIHFLKFGFVFMNNFNDTSVNGVKIFIAKKTSNYS